VTDDTANLKRARWTQWNIDLTGVNLNNVTFFAIGIEKTGAVGTAGRFYFDDIRLYSTPPALAVAVAPSTLNIRVTGSLTKVPVRQPRIRQARAEMV